MKGAAGTLELVVGELVANAVRYGTGPMEVAMAAHSGRVRVEVHDRGGGRPVLRAVEPTGRAIGGWGLRMVDQLVDAWGSDVSDGRTVVWVEKLIPPAW